MERIKHASHHIMDNDTLCSSICTTGTIIGAGHLLLDPCSVVGDSAVDAVVAILRVEKIT